MPQSLECQELCENFTSCDDDDEYEDGYEFVDFHIMGSGITPKSQPIDICIGKLLKGFTEIIMICAC